VLGVLSSCRYRLVTCGSLLPGNHLAKRMGLVHKLHKGTLAPGCKNIRSNSWRVVGLQAFTSVDVSGSALGG